MAAPAHEYSCPTPNFLFFPICSAAIIIKEERSRNKGYTFNDYLTNMEKGEPRVEVPSSLSEAVKKLADSDSDLKLVSTGLL